MDRLVKSRDGVLQYLIDEEAQVIRAYAYSSAHRPLINKLLPTAFTSLYLPLDFKDNLTLTTTLENRVTEHKDFSKYTHGAIPDALGRTFQRLLGGSIIYGYPIKAKLSKPIGALLYMFKAPQATQAQKELMQTFADQVAIAFGARAGFERLEQRHKKSLERLEHDNEESPEIKFTLRITQTQDQKLAQKAKNENKPILQLP